MLSDSRGNRIYFSDCKRATPEELDAVITGVIDRARDGEKEWKAKQANKRQARRATAKDRK